ncbi:MAG TPA: hypothetical protein VFM75_03340 [Modicisalibacter sp.]|nr:hypothetical protein [Modicisalibacter sp.]
MSRQRVNRGQKSRGLENAIYEDSQIEQYLLLLIYSKRHTTAESLFAELGRMLPAVDPMQVNRVGHRFASELKAAGLSLPDD